MYIIVNFESNVVLHCGSGSTPDKPAPMPGFYLLARLGSFPGRSILSLHFTFGSVLPTPHSITRPPADDDMLALLSVLWLPASCMDRHVLTKTL